MLQTGSRFPSLLVETKYTEVAPWVMYNIRILYITRAFVLTSTGQSSRRSVEPETDLSMNLYNN